VIKALGDVRQLEGADMYVLRLPNPSSCMHYTFLYSKPCYECTIFLRKAITAYGLRNVYYSEDVHLPTMPNRHGKLESQLSAARDSAALARLPKLERKRAQWNMRRAAGGAAGGSGAGGGSSPLAAAARAAVVPAGAGPGHCAGSGASPAGPVAATVASSASTLLMREQTPGLLHGQRAVAAACACDCHAPLSPLRAPAAFGPRSAATTASLSSGASVRSSGSDASTSVGCAGDSRSSVCGSVGGSTVSLRACGRQPGSGAVSAVWDGGEEEVSRADCDSFGDTGRRVRGGDDACCGAEGGYECGTGADEEGQDEGGAAASVDASTDVGSDEEAEEGQAERATDSGVRRLVALSLSVGSAAASAALLRRLPFYAEDLDVDRFAHAAAAAAAAAGPVAARVAAAGASGGEASGACTSAARTCAACGCAPGGAVAALSSSCSASSVSSVLAAQTPAREARTPHPWPRLSDVCGRLVSREECALRRAAVLPATAYIDRTGHMVLCRSHVRLPQRSAAGSGGGSSDGGAAGDAGEARAAAAAAGGSSNSSGGGGGGKLVLMGVSTTLYDIHATFQVFKRHQAESFSRRAVPCVCGGCGRFVTVAREQLQAQQPELAAACMAASLSGGGGAGGGKRGGGGQQQQQHTGSGVPQKRKTAWFKGGGAASRGVKAAAVPSAASAAGGSGDAFSGGGGGSPGGPFAASAGGASGAGAGAGAFELALGAGAGEVPYAEVVSRYGRYFPGSGCGSAPGAGGAKRRKNAVSSRR
jgi:hypothetical protein